MQNISPVLWQFCHRAHRVPQPGQTAEVHAPNSRLSFGNDQFYFYCRAQEPPSHLKLQKRLGLNKAVIFLQGCFSLAVRKPFRHWLFLSGTANELQLQRETSKAVEFPQRWDALLHLLSIEVSTTGLHQSF